MTYARVFQSGNSQAVRLPKDFRFEVDEVEILRQGDDVVLRVPRRSAAVVTNNEREFVRVEGLSVENWVGAANP